MMHGNTKIKSINYMSEGEIFEIKTLEKSDVHTQHLCLVHFFLQSYGF